MTPHVPQTSALLLGIPLPHLLQVTLTEIGSITAGLALFLTGLVLSAQTIEFSGNALVSTLLTIVVRPLIAFFAVRAAGLTGELAEETLLLLAIPAGFFGIALSAGVTKDEIVELFIHLEAYAGAARAFDSYQIALAVFGEHTSE